MTASHDPPGERTREIPIPVPAQRWLLQASSEGVVVSRLIRPGDMLIVGSHPSSDLVLGDRTVSAHHCRVRACASGVTVEDLGSRNGLVAGQARVQTARLSSSGASVVVGRSVLSVLAPAESPAAPELALPGLVGDSPGMRAVSMLVRRFAALSKPVLVQGESGTGKDLVARSLHDLSGRPGAFVVVNAGGLSESLADSEIFGHAKGAFTGAATARAGAFAEADRGTLFLDEIADLSPALQVKLLRVVEGGTFRPLGSSKDRRVDVRVVAASWASLAEAVHTGSFRQDLYHRLAQLVLRLPPLRERKADIPALAAALLQRHAGELGERRLTSDAIGELLLLEWPGNVRELSAVLYRAAITCADSWIDGAAIRRAVEERGADGWSRGSVDLEELVLRCGGNVSRAARLAGLARTTFRERLRKARGPALPIGRRAG